MDVKSLYKQSIYPIDLDSSDHIQNASVLTLADLSSQKIVLDASSTRRAIQVIPHDLCYNLMKASLTLTRDRSIEVLIANWPHPVLSLRKFAPPLFRSLAMRYDDTHLQEMVRRAVKLTTCLAHTFVECLKKRAPTRLKCLDLTGYPAAEVIVNYLSSHVLLVFNEQRQREIINIYNQVTENLPHEQKQQYNLDNTLPDHSFMICLDAHLESSDTHMEVCRALKTGRNEECKFRFAVHTLDISCLGVARISVLLEQVDHMSLQALSLQFNAINKEGLQILCPTLKRCTQLTALDLSCNGFRFTVEHEICETLSEIFECLSCLTRLDLSNNRTKHKLRFLLSSLPLGLEYLRLCACGLSYTDLTYLKHSHHASTLKEVDLSENQIGSEKWGPLSDLLQKLATKLVILELEDCSIEQRDFLSLFSLLSVMQSLRYLNISRNENLTSQIIMDSAENLAGICTLEVLKLSYPIECYVSTHAEEMEPVKHLFKSTVLSHYATVCEKKMKKPIDFRLIGP